MSKSTRFAAIATAATVLTLIIVACDEYPVAPDNSLARRESVTKADLQREMAAIKAATAAYNNIANARADGYVDDGFGCIEDPELGGMGWHLIRDDLHADPAVDPLH